MERKDCFVKSRILTLGFCVYIALSIFEFALVGSIGSLLRYYGILMMGYWLIYVFKDKKIIRLPSFLLLFVLWAVYNLISLLWTPAASEGMYLLISSTNMICILIVAYHIVWAPRDFELFKTIYILSAAICAAIIIFSPSSYRGGGTRYSIMFMGVESDPNNISAMIFPAIVFAIDNIVLKPRKKLHDYLYNLIVIAVTLMGCFKCSSRGGLLAIVASVVVYFGFFTFSVRHSKKMFGTFLLIIALAAIGIVTAFSLDEASFNRLFVSSYTEYGGSGRTDVWGKGLELFRSNPIFGVGIGGANPTGNNMHNMHLFVLCNSGIVGYLFFIGGQLSIVKTLIKRRNIVGTAVMAGMLVAILFLDAYQKKFMWNPMLLSIIFISMSTRESLYNTDIKYGINLPPKYIAPVNS